MADAAKLPVWRTVYDAHVITIENFLTLLRVGWVWVLLLAVTDAALHWFLWPWEEAAIAQGGSGSMSLLLLSTYVWTLFGACVAVPWHRLVLKGDVITAGGMWPLAKDIGRYISWALFLTLFILGPFLLALFAIETNLTGSVDGLVADQSEVPAGATDPATWPCLICAGALLIPISLLAYVPVRLSLVLPAIALSRHDFGAGDSWRATRWSFWRLYLGYFLTMTATFVLLAFALSLTGLDEVRTREIAVRDALIADTILFLAGMFTVTYMSLAYRHLVEDPATMSAQ